MTPREVHIAIDLGLQKLGSFAYDNIKPEFIDMVFNRMGDAYITEKTTRPLDPKQLGFEDTQSRLATIRELVTETNVKLYTLNSESLFSLLPCNFFSFIEARASVIYSCNNSPVSYTTIPAYINNARVSFDGSYFTDTPYKFDNLKLYKIVNGITTKIFDFTHHFNPSTLTADDIFMVINTVLDEINNVRAEDFKVYYESRDNIYYANDLIFVNEGSEMLSNFISVDYTASTNTAFPFVTTTYSSPSLGSGTNFSEKKVFCRLLSNEETYHMLAHPFGTTSQDSPIINILGDRIISHVNERFILKGLTLKYIRKPRRMSLSLNQSYELQDSRAINKIIDMTVEYLSATIESQGLQALTIQNQQRD